MPNTLLTRTPRESIVPEWQSAWDAMTSLTGDATFVEAFAQRPDLLNFVMNHFYMAIFFGGKVDNRYKQLARLRLSIKHGCQTCNKQNVPGALSAGFTPQQVEALANDQIDVFTPAEQAVIRYADQVALTNMDGDMTPQLFAQLRAHFSEGDILELGTAMAVICGMAKLSFVLGVVDKEPYCPFAATAAAA
jgi:alkylhydroperoxidase family enzyme